MATAAPAKLRPAEGLVGVTLPTGWLLEEQRPGYAGKTGSNFCVGYTGVKDGVKAFIKVVDVLGVVREATDFISDLLRATAEVEAERSTLNLCKDKALSRIIHIIESGQAQAPHYGSSPEGTVFYFVFERANSDVREQISLGHNAHAVWNFRVLRDVALAIDQLQRVGVAHQDIKPSNILLMEPPEKAGIHKLGDFGRAVRKEVAGPHDVHVFPGDQRYAPLSAFYGLREAEWTDGRVSTDLYMLGLLACYLFSGANLTELQLLAIPDVLKPGKWPGSFGDALPILVDVHARALEKIAPSFPEPFRQELITIVKQLTHPNPTLRGDTKARARKGKPVGTEVFVSRFERLAKQAEIRRPA